MKIFLNTGGLAETNAYLLADVASGAAAIVDAPQSTTSTLLALARQHGFDVQYLLLTHGHWDHISDHAVVTNAFPKCQVLIHPLDAPKLQHPGSEFYELPYTIPPRNPDAYLDDGNKIHIGQLTLSVLHTPGHTAGHCVLYLPDHATLFTGDLLFAGGVGRYDLSDGHEPTLQKSLRRVFLLPDNTKVLSGHGPATTLARERAHNFYIVEHGLGAS